MSCCKSINACLLCEVSRTEVLFLIRWGVPRRGPSVWFKLNEFTLLHGNFCHSPGIHSISTGLAGMQSSTMPTTKMDIGHGYADAMSLHGCFSYFSKIRQSPIARIHCCHAKRSRTKPGMSNRILFPPIWFPSASFDLTINYFIRTNDHKGAIKIRVAALSGHHPDTKSGPSQGSWYH